MGIIQEPIRGEPLNLNSANSLIREIRGKDIGAVDAGSLAQATGLSYALVSTTLQQMREANDLDKHDSFLKDSRKLGDYVRDLASRLTARPVLFTAASSAVCIGVCLGLKAASVAHPALANGIYAAMLLTLAAQLSTYYHHGLARVALYGSLVNWLMIVGLATFELWDQEPDHQLHWLAAVSLTTFLLMTPYVLASSLAAVAGGYRCWKSVEHHLANLTRHEKLQRLFEIRRIIRDQQVKDKPVRPARMTAVWQAQYRARPWLHSAVLGVSSSLLGLAVLRLTNTSIQPASLPSLTQLMALTSLATLNLTMVVGIAFLLGRFSRAAINLIWLTAWSTATMYIPIAPYGSAFAQRFLSAEMLIPQMALLFAATVLGSVGAAVEERAAKSRRLHENDPAALLAELARLELSLAAGEREVTVLVVDVAKSTEMKANSDPLDAEYSFREYQQLLARITHLYGGTVHSTAGDGAVLTFEEPSSAFRAAKEIQTKISEFNESVNRLPSKFRLRVGIHAGQVPGELSEVQFSEVIDIAAHVQAKAPLRGILVTKEVAEQLGDEELIPLKEPVDGHEVLLAYNPVVDE
ncbi:MAG: adenylate/guanylate cyclase domain-containing protein [Armatimonadetes bacterium]|nr:adenylate/guanylate cyclase domain-containing protein [Armatimonadota bacterium]